MSAEATVNIGHRHSGTIVSVAQRCFVDTRARLAVPGPYNAAFGGFAKVTAVCCRQDLFDRKISVAGLARVYVNNAAA